jgi:hypothetical protein
MAKLNDAEIELERQLAYSETIMSPAYIEGRIIEYEHEIWRCKDMIRFYKKSLRELKNPKTKAHAISKKYKLQ